jgi:hypothetical protein
MNNEAVLDKETGLVWERTPDATIRTWFDAVIYAYDKNVGGRKGWRLPTVEELASLVDQTQSNPALPSGNPFIGVLSTGYWSSTTYVNDTSGAQLVGFGDGSAFQVGGKSNLYGRVWCVRGGHGYNAP